MRTHPGAVRRTGARARPPGRGRRAPSRCRPPRTYQPPKACSTYGHGRQRRGRAARVGAGVGGVAVEEHPQPRVAQVAPAERAQRPAGGDGGDVARPPQRQPGEVAGPSSGDSRNGPRLASQTRAGPGGEGRASRRRRRADQAVERGAQCRSRSSAASKPRAVGEAVAGDRVERRRARARPASRRCRRTGRGRPAAASAGTGRCRSGTPESGHVGGDQPELAADVVAGLADGDVVALRRRAGRRRRGRRHRRRSTTTRLTARPALPGQRAPAARPAASARPARRAARPRPGAPARRAAGPPVRRAATTRPATPAA